ncbi:uncharacterized protein EHS24_009313 [Apiotrichum porosum]|uniref:Uncharacterized protein n=1 Tax=Apiotrichum porosum TaxID=105984 RepID=A0A427XL96_9TREE|nr:uncharacterized protein EHS24_009313 [Apiotrichum porosum]RSH79661.1 hypothetical protein EHS24_009313 [Apiotrichum porosum]
MPAPTPQLTAAAAAGPNDVITDVEIFNALRALCENHAAIRDHNVKLERRIAEVERHRAEIVHELVQLRLEVAETQSTQQKLRQEIEQLEASFTSAKAALAGQKAETAMLNEMLKTVRDKMEELEVAAATTGVKVQA